MEHGKGDRLDFFLSYAQADRAWAEWIAWTLEAGGARVKLQAWDSPAGSNWIQDMDAGIRDAARTIAVLSPDYLKSVYGTAEWQAIWAQDPEGKRQKLLPVRVIDCAGPGLLAGIVSIDLFEINEETARRRLRESVEGALKGRQKPKVAPSFPPSKQPGRQPPFPGVSEVDQSTESEEITRKASVTDISAFRLRTSRGSSNDPIAGLPQELIDELSELAERISNSYSAGNSAYVWTRLEVKRKSASIQFRLERVRDWLDQMGIADDPGIVSLTYDLRQYAGTAEGFARSLDNLALAQSSARREGLLVDYEASWRSLRDLFGRIQADLELIPQSSSDPTGSR
jgi:hypothetical protein